MATESKAAQRRREADEGAALAVAPLPEPDPPEPEELGTYVAVYGMWRDGDYLPPGALFHAYPSDPRVLAKQARPLRVRPTAEQGAALLAALGRGAETVAVTIVGDSTETWS